MLSTLLQGTTVEWLAGRLGVTTSEPALPRPLVEMGTVRRLGAEIVEYPVGPDDAIAGQLVRELGLPRDALLSVIVRGDEALLPRGSTRIEAHDRLHVLVREEVAEEMDDLLERWRVGPVGLPVRHRPQLRSGSAVFTARRWREADGDAGFPKEVEGVPVAEQIRTRRDVRRCARAARGRPLGRHGPDPRAGRAAPAAALRAQAADRGGRRRGARVVAGGDRRAGPLRLLLSVHGLAYSRLAGLPN